MSWHELYDKYMIIMHEPRLYIARQASYTIFVRFLGFLEELPGDASL